MSGEEFILLLLFIASIPIIITIILYNKAKTPFFIFIPSIALALAFLLYISFDDFDSASGTYTQGMGEAILALSILLVFILTFLVAIPLFFAKRKAIKNFNIKIQSVEDKILTDKEIFNSIDKKIENYK
ncbi:MAG: hypothetical protein IPO21_18050 [Bacteroidales bacterium]|nr:hypothetical protein [Bacteroidales bacterium]